MSSQQYANNLWSKLCFILHIFLTFIAFLMAVVDDSKITEFTNSTMKAPMAICELKSSVKSNFEIFMLLASSV